MFKKMFLFVAVIVSLVLASCGMGLGQHETGSIKVEIGNNIARSILPPAGSMDVASYSLTGVGPGGATFGPVIITGGTTATVDSLMPGSWTVTAVARNAAVQAIGSGSGSATVTIGATIGCAITVMEATSPNGTYALSVTFTEEVLNPTVTGTIKDATGTGAEGNQIFVNPHVSPAISVTSLVAGWYVDIVQLKSGTTLVAGFAEAVRVAAARQTSATVSLERTGVISVNITPDFADPLDLTGTPALGTPVDVSTGGTYNFSIVAKLKGDTKATNNFWYLNGALLSPAAAIDLDESLIPIGSTARLDVVAFSAADAGRHAGSGTWQVTRVATDTEKQLITGTLDMTDWASHGWTTTTHEARVVFGDAGNRNQGGGAVAADGTFSFPISGVGSYSLGVYVWAKAAWEQFPGSYFAYWSVGGNVSNPANATMVLMPHDGKPSSVVHNFGPELFTP